MNQIEQEHSDELTDINNFGEQATVKHVISPDATSRTSIQIEEGNTGTTKVRTSRILIVEDSISNTLEEMFSHNLLQALSPSFFQDPKLALELVQQLLQRKN